MVIPELRRSYHIIQEITNVSAYVDDVEAKYSAEDDYDVEIELLIARKNIDCS